MVTMYEEDDYEYEEEEEIEEPIQKPTNLPVQQVEEVAIKMQALMIANKGL